MKSHCLLLFFSCLTLVVNAQPSGTCVVVDMGQMPNLAKDQNGVIHLIYGKGDSIMYALSNDGRSFSQPSLIGILPKLYSFAMRGPQIAATAAGLVVTACTQNGTIFSFYKRAGGSWTKPQRVNTIPETAKEGLMALCAEGMNVYAVWLNVKNPNRQTIQGALSTDGGRTWSKSFLVYDSPDGTVCQCCKPSVAVFGNKVYVQFRNSLGGIRDLYLAISNDRGKSFASAQKLGFGSWRLQGCPMDGGGLISTKGALQSVWRREAKIFTVKPGEKEKEIGEGRSPTLEAVGSSIVYAWTKDGYIVVVAPTGNIYTLGKGSQCQLKALNDKQVVCVWESEKRILASVVTLL